MSPEPGFGPRLWEALDSFRPMLRLVFFLDLALLCLTLLLLARGDLPADAFVISIVNVFVLAATLVLVGYALRRTAS